MSSNEALENTVAAFRADVAALRNEVLVGTTRIDQDIRELRADSKILRDKIDGTFASLSAKIDGVSASLTAKIDGVSASLTAKIDANYASLDQKYVSLDRKMDAQYASLDLKIENSHASLDKKIDTKVDEVRADMKDVRAEMKEMRADIKDMTRTIDKQQGMQKAILWVLGALVTIVGVGLPVAKALRWI